MLSIAQCDFCKNFMKLQEGNKLKGQTHLRLHIHVSGQTESSLSVYTTNSERITKRKSRHKRASKDLESIMDIRAVQIILLPLPQIQADHTIQGFLGHPCSVPAGTEGTVQIHASSYPVSCAFLFLKSYTAPLNSHLSLL